VGSQTMLPVPVHVVRHETLGTPVVSSWQHCAV
jgi:hypothetical protein